MEKRFGNGKTFARVDFDEKIFKAVKDIVKIFQLKRNYNLSLLSVESFVRQLKNSYAFSSHFYYCDDKSDKTQKKFSAAVGSYAKISGNEKPLLLMDSTVFGSAKGGFFITDKEIYAHGRDNFLLPTIICPSRRIKTTF